MQQTPLESRCRDSILEVGDKVLAVEFKAPSCRGSADAAFLSYDGVDLDKLGSVAGMLGWKNVFLGLIHAFLCPKSVDCSRADGEYMWLAAPGTTAFIDYMRLKRYLGDINASIVVRPRELVRLEYVNTPVPTCAQQTVPLIKCLPHCASCGGLFYRGGIRMPTIEVYVDGKPVSLKTYTLASLLYYFSGCRIGYVITEGDGAVGVIRRFLGKRSTSLFVGVVGSLGMGREAGMWPIKTIIVIPGGLTEG